MTIIHRFPLLCCCCALAAAALSPSATAAGQVLYEDSFDAAAGMTIAWLPPAVTGRGAGLDGNVYARHGGRFWILSTLSPRGLAVGADCGASLPLGQDPDFQMPERLTLAFTFNLNTLSTGGHPIVKVPPVQNQPPHRGMALGFWKKPQGSNGLYPADPQHEFLGVAVGRSGKINLVSNKGSAALFSVAAGNFTWDADHTLSYTIDTRTGKIVALVLDGIGYPAFSGAPALFDNAALGCVGFVANASLPDDGYGIVKHFSVTAE